MRKRREESIRDQPGIAPRMVGEGEKIIFHRPDDVNGDLHPRKGKCVVAGPQGRVECDNRTYTLVAIRMAGSLGGSRLGRSFFGLNRPTGSRSRRHARRVLASPVFARVLRSAVVPHGRGGEYRTSQCNNSGSARRVAQSAYSGAVNAPFEQRM